MPTILLVDDDVTLLERLATLLAEAGYEVLRANQVQYAEILLRERRPELVLLDPDMSSGDGWVLLGSRASQVPIIVISGQGLEEDIVRGLDSGAADYLPKPFGTNELLARIRTQLRAQARAEVPALAAPALADLPAPATGPTTPLAPPAPRRRGAVAPGDEEEQVFISYGEEGRIMREERATAAEELSDIAQLPLGQRLHAARQRKRLTLVQAELETRPTVPMHYIQAMEEEKFSLLPRGEMAEELLRSYATFVGVDVANAVDEYRRLHYIAPLEPPSSLGGAPAPRRLPAWPISIVAAVLAIAVGLGAIWAYDSAGLLALAQRAGLIAAPTSAPTAAPTSAPAPTGAPAPTSAPTAAPTSAPRPTATTTITSTAAPSP